MNRLLTQKSNSIALTLFSTRGDTGTSTLSVRNVVFQNNSASESFLPVISIFNADNVIFDSSSFLNNSGVTVVYAHSSVVYFQGTVRFVSN